VSEGTSHAFGVYVKWYNELSNHTPNVRINPK